MERNINSQVNNGRFREIDIMKGIGIILMVMGHCGFPYTHWIFLFHMAVFFMISGYCYNDTYANSIQGVCKLIKKRVLDLYVPYVIVNSMFLLLTNIFLRLNIYTEDPNFILMLGDNVGSNTVITSISLAQALKQIALIFFCVGGTQLGGPTWFFGVLFIVTIAHTVIIFWGKKLKEKLAQFMCASLIGLLIAFLSVATSGKIQFPLDHFLTRVGLGYLAFLIGIAIKKFLKDGKSELFSKNTFFGGLFSFLMLVFLDKYVDISMARAEITSLGCFIICALCGYVFIFAISFYVNKYSIWFSDMFAYIGKNTRGIVCLHMISFKIVSYGIITISGLPAYMLASFPVIDSVKSWVWIIYTIVGIVVPLFITNMYHWISKLR